MAISRPMRFLSAFEKLLFKLWGEKYPADAVEPLPDFWEALPLLCVEDNSTVGTIDEICASYFELKGMNSSSMKGEKSYLYAHNLVKFFEGLPEDLSASLITLRLADAPTKHDLIDGCIGNHKKILEACETGFQRSYTNRFYLVIQTKQSPWLVQPETFFEALKKSTYLFGKHEEDPDALPVPETFHKFMKTVEHRLSDYGAKLLKGNSLFSALATLLAMEHRQLNRGEDWMPILKRFCQYPQPKWHLEEPEILYLRTPRQRINNLSACLTLQAEFGGPQKINDHPLDSILSLDREFIMIQRIDVLESEKTKKTMKRKLDIFNMTNMRFKKGDLQRMEQFNEEIVADEFKLCNFSTQIHLVEHAKDELEAACNELQAAFSKQSVPSLFTENQSTTGRSGGL